MQAAPQPTQVLEVDRLIVRKELIVSDTGQPWEEGYEAHQIPRGSREVLRPALPLHPSHGNIAIAISMRSNKGMLMGFATAIWDLDDDPKGTTILKARRS
ncbi:MAG: hypothetical protein O3C40_07950 [Planctomycetota bacterium]|nr:hypothetical protein [Planctomycetota bacterium]